MSLNPLAPAFLPQYQSSSDPPTSLCNSTAMSLPLAQLFCGMPSQVVPSHAPSINHNITDGTLLLSLLQPTNQSKPDAAVHQPTPGSSAPLPSSLQHQANCLQAIHKKIQQFNQHLKAEHLDRQTSQVIALQLQNDFAWLCYLHFSPVEAISNKAITVKNSATSPQFNPKAYPNPNPTSSAFPPSGPSEHKLLRSTPVGAVGPLRTKTNNTANADFQPTPNTQELLQLWCRTSHQEFANWKNCLPKKYQLTHPSLRGSIPNTSSLMINFASLNRDIQMSLFGKFPQWSLYSTLQKWPDHHLIPSLSRPLALVVLSSGPTPMDTTSSSNSTRMVLHPLRASVLQFYSPSSLETMTIFSNGPSQSSSTLVIEINLTQWLPGWRQPDLTMTQPTRNQQGQQKLELQQS